MEQWRDAGFDYRKHGICRAGPRSPLAGSVAGGNAYWFRRGVFRPLPDRRVPHPGIPARHAAFWRCPRLSRRPARGRRCGRASRGDLQRPHGQALRGRDRRDQSWRQRAHRTDGGRARRQDFRLRLELQHLWQRRRRGKARARRDRSLDRLCALQDRIPNGRCRNLPIAGMVITALRFATACGMSDRIAARPRAQRLRRLRARQQRDHSSSATARRGGR